MRLSVVTAAGGAHWPTHAAAKPGPRAPPAARRRVAPAFRPRLHVTPRHTPAAPSARHQTFVRVRVRDVVDEEAQRPWSRTDGPLILRAERKDQRSLTVA